MEMLVSSALDPGSALPSFFEMFMTHQIQLSLKPAVRHVIGALVLRIPALWPLARRFEEAYLLLSLAVEGQFLAQHDCLMVESFYALGRSRLARHGPSGGSSSANSRGGHRLGAADAHAAINLADFVRLTARDRRKALLIAVLLPYAKARLDALHAQCVARSREATAAGSAGSIAGAAGAAAVAAFEGGAAGGNSNGGGSTSTAAGAAQLAAVAVRRRLAAASAATAAQLFVSAYPCVHACYEGAFLAYHWLYLFGRSAYFSPALHAVGQVVRRSTAAAADDDGAFSGEASSGAIGGSGSSVGGGGGGSEGEGAGLPTLGDKALRYGRAALVAAVVLFKVMEWWTAVEAREGFWKAGAHVDVPPPLPMPPAADADDNGGGGGSSGSGRNSRKRGGVRVSGGGTSDSGGARSNDGRMAPVVPLPADPGTCALCRAPLTNATLCAASGYVFCYRCVAAHVRRHGRCPVTRVRCSEGDLRKLYDDGDRPDPS